MKSSPSIKKDFWFCNVLELLKKLIICQQQIKYIEPLTIIQIFFTFEFIPIKSEDKLYVINFF